MTEPVDQVDDATEADKTKDADLEPATLEQLLGRKLPTSTLPYATGDGKPRHSLQLRALSAPAFEALQNAHPPVDVLQRWNPETFQPALVSACLVKPKLSEAECAQLRDIWSHGDWIELFAEVLDLCDRGRLGEPSRG